MVTINDQLSNKLTLSKPATRIVSLVPSLTELLFDMGLEESIVGRTKFCVFPETKVDRIEIIGGTKNVNIDKVKKLQPDFVIANKEENLPDIVGALQEEIPVYVSDIFDIASCLQVIQDIGKATGKTVESMLISGFIEKEKEQFLRPKIQSCIYLIWKNPFMTVGTDTFIYSMLEEAGFNSLVDEKRYPTLSLEEIQNLQPKYLFLSNEPYPFKEKDRKELQSKLPNTKVSIIDATYFSWYGSRIVKSFDYFFQLHKELANMS